MGFDGFDSFMECDRDHHAFGISIPDQVILVFLFESERDIGPVHIKIAFIGIGLLLDFLDGHFRTADRENG